MRALTPLRSKIRRRNDVVVTDFGRLVASSVFDAALCSSSTSHNPHAGEHDPSACGGQLLIVRPFVRKVYLMILLSMAILMSITLIGIGWLKFWNVEPRKSPYIYMTYEDDYIGQRKTKSYSVDSDFIS